MAGKKTLKISSYTAKRFGASSAKLSAKLENRQLPDGYEMSAKAKSFLSKRRKTS